MLISENILAFLLATTATIVATLTGLIGAFATFRLQNIKNEVALLLEIVRHRTTPLGTLDEWIEENDYAKLEKIYDLDETAVGALSEVLEKSGFLKQSGTFEFNLSNIRRNHEKYRRIKSHNISMFIWSLSFVFVSLILLVLTDFLLSLWFIWFIIVAYFIAILFTFFQFVRQIERLIEN